MTDQKRIRTAWQGLDQDMISRLPDPILSHILCFLPIRDAVQTTILSKRWNNLWISIPNLDLDKYEIGGNFEDFVDRLLSLHSSSNIQKFRLHSGSKDNTKEDDYLSCTSRWICDAIKHNVVELDLNLFLFDNFHGRSRRLTDLLPLTLSFFTCKTLVALKVNSNCMNLAPPPSASACFPSLKSLDFNLRRPGGSASMLEKLVSKCPVLEDLTIDAYALFEKDVYTLNIHGAALKRFKIVGQYLTADKYSFSINAPKLEKFVVSGEAGLSNYNFSNNAKAMVKAMIHSTHPDFKEEYYKIMHVESAPRLLERVSGVECLCLSAPRYSASSLPCFYNLKHLKLRMFLCSYWEYVMELLKRSPNLEDIVLDICSWTWTDKWYHMEGFQPFQPPEVVPACVSSHLKTISIINFFGFEDEFDVVKYLLKHSEVLRRLTISTCERYLIKSRRMVPEKLHKKALMLQKYSKTCEIEVMISSKIQNKECSCNDDISQV